MTSEQPRRRSLVDKLLHRDSSNHPKTHHNTTATTNPDPETQSITGLLPSSIPPPPSTRTLTLPLTGGGTETLIVPNDQIPADPANSDPSSWNFHHKARHASVAASDTGENVAAASDVEKARFAKLMQETKGMNAEQVKEFLKGKGVVDGAKVMRRWEEGKGGEGYMQVVGADRGTF